MLPRYTQQGERASNALSLILPPGKTAHGFAIVPTPSCSLNSTTITELVLNLTGELGADADILLNGLAVEYLNNNVGEENQVMNLEKVDLNNTMQVKSVGQSFNISLAPSEGAGQQTLFTPAAPFPSKVLYWGSGYSQ